MSSLAVVPTRTTCIDPECRSGCAWRGHFCEDHLTVMAVSLAARADLLPKNVPTISAIRSEYGHAFLTQAQAEHVHAEAIRLCRECQQPDVTESYHRMMIAPVPIKPSLLNQSPARSPRRLRVALATLRARVMVWWFEHTPERLGEFAAGSAFALVVLALTAWVFTNVVLGMQDAYLQMTGVR